MAGGQLILAGGGRAIGPNGGRVILGDGPCECCGPTLPSACCLPDGRCLTSAALIATGLCSSPCVTDCLGNTQTIAYRGMNGAWNPTDLSASLGSLCRARLDIPQSHVVQRVWSQSFPPCSGSITSFTRVCRLWVEVTVERPASNASIMRLSATIGYGTERIVPPDPTQNTACLPFGSGPSWATFLHQIPPAEWLTGTVSRTDTGGIPPNEFSLTVSAEFG